MHNVIGVNFREHLRLDNHTRHITSTCYVALQILKEFKAGEIYADGVFYPYPQFSSRWCGKFKLATAIFVLGRYVEN